MKDMKDDMKDMKGDIKDIKGMKSLLARQTELERRDMSLAERVLKNYGKK